MPVRAIEVGGEARGDEARPLPMRHPLKQGRRTDLSGRARAAEEERRAEEQQGGDEQGRHGLRREDVLLGMRTGKRSVDGGSRREERNQRRRAALGPESMAERQTE